MNDRQRFVATMHYEDRDRCPMYDFNFWAETLPEWHKQGLPQCVDRRNVADWFGLDLSMAPGCPDRTTTDVLIDLCPPFEEKVIEDRGDRALVQQADGVRAVRLKHTSAIPHPEARLLVDRDSWRRHYKPRLDPDHPQRLSDGWDERCKRWTDPDRDHILELPGGSLYGQLRMWMGLENISLVVHDEPAWFEEMVTTVADCILGVLEKLLSTGARFEICKIWEDMCYNAGPLLSPTHFKRYLSPHYRRITERLHRSGVDVVWVDCDGKIDELIPLWLEVGVNCMAPVEIGSWGADPVRYRAQYGRDLLMMGGFDKRLLAGTKEAIEREVHRLVPLVEEGGYIPFCDHRVPPDVPLDNYLFYLETARRVWGHGVNLKPMRIHSQP